MNLLFSSNFKAEHSKQKKKVNADPRRVPVSVLLSLDELISDAGGFKQLFDKLKASGLNVEEQITRVFGEESPLFSLAQFSIKKITKGYAELTFPRSEQISRRGGMVHGGMISYALDSAGGLAVMSENTGVDQLTLELKINFLEPAKSSPFTVIGRVLRQGRNVAVSESELKDSESRLCAKSLGTWYMVH